MEDALRAIASGMTCATRLPALIPVRAAHARVEHYDRVAQEILLILAARINMTQRDAGKLLQTALALARHRTPIPGLGGTKECVIMAYLVILRTQIVPDTTVTIRESNVNDSDTLVTEKARRKP